MTKEKTSTFKIKEFKEDVKQFYRYLEVKTTDIKDHPQMEVELYWKSLWERKA